MIRKVKQFRTVLRFILAALFLVAAGGIGFRFLQPGAPPLEAQEFLISLTSAGYIWPVMSLLFFAASVLLCFRRTIGIALLLPIPLFANFSLYHIFLDPSIMNAWRGLLVMCLHIACIVLYKDRFRSLICRSD